MVGGVVINTVSVDESVWIQCQDRDRKDTCAIRVRKDLNAIQVKAGDLVWWQSRLAFWTPKPPDGRVEVFLERVGASHSHIPDDVMAKVLS